MEWPQIAIIVILAAQFGINLAWHGKSIDNFDAICGSIDLAIIIFILYEGGFWK